MLRASDPLIHAEIAMAELVSMKCSGQVSHQLQKKAGLAKAFRKRGGTLDSLEEHEEPLLQEGEKAPEIVGFTFRQATTTMFNCMVGASVLALPFAVAKAGLFGFVVLSAVACMMGATAYLIGANLAIVAERPEAKDVPPSCHDWSLIGSIAFGSSGKAVISILFLCDLSSCLVTFLIASGINLPLIAPELLEPVSATVLSGILAFGLLYVPIRFFAYFSVLGIVAQLVMFLFLLMTGAGVAREDPGLIANDFKLIDATALTGMLGCFIGCFNAHSTVPTVYQNVIDKSQWFGIVFTSTMMAFAFYTIVGLVGYAAFGHQVSQAFTANLGRNMKGEPLDGMEFMAPLSAALIATKMLVTVPAMSRPIVAFIEARARFAQGWVGSMLIKASLTTVLTVLAVLGRSMLPYVTAVRGAVVQVLIAIVMPQAAFITLQWDTLTMARKSCLILLAIGAYLVTVPGAVEDVRVIAAAAR